LLSGNRAFINPILGKDIPVDLFQFPDTAAQYIVIPIAMLLYAFVWRYIAGNLNRIFAIE
jgi:hypothetical protein